jgi:transcriptional regulator with XRE-family HTH domain
MGPKKPIAKQHVQSGAAQTNGSSVARHNDRGDDLPMGTNQRRGRRPKGPSPFTKNFNRLLKETGCSHRQAAALAGVSPSVISGWTAGSVPNDPNALLKITEALKADFQYILTGKPTDTVSSQRIGEIFDIEDQPNLTGIFQLELRRLKLRR